MKRNLTLALLIAVCLAFTPACSGQVERQPPQAAGVTAFEGARLITGDGSAPIENSIFIVDNNQFTAFGRRGEVQVPAGAARVDLTGKTVMPTMVDLHGHVGFQNVAEGTMSKEMYTRENLIDHLQLLAYNGVGAVVGVGDLVSRSDLHGGRTNWGDVPLRVRDEVVPGAALFGTAGPGIAWPGSGAQGHPSRMDVSYPVSTVDEARAAVRDYVAMKPLFIKMWVDDRGGTKKTLTPQLYRAVVEEAHKYNVPVGVHNVTLANAKELMRAGVEGWLHVPARGGEEADDELVSIVKDRIARKDRPNIWMTPSLITSWMNTQGGTRPEWLDDPLLQAAYSQHDIEEHWGNPLKKMTADEVARARRSFESEARSAMKLRAAGVTIVNGTDTGQTRFWIGLFDHLDLESMVAMGMTPSEVIVAATRDSAAMAGINNTGLVAAGKSADFIVLDANPLERISNTRKIDKVYLRGVEVDRAALRARWLARRKISTN
jgi:imidazolonepropionase-like amidohydrolase